MFRCTLRYASGKTEPDRAFCLPQAIVTSPALIDKGKNYALMWPWLGDGLLLLGGEWRGTSAGCRIADSHSVKGIRAI